VSSLAEARAYVAEDFDARWRAVSERPAYQWPPGYEPYPHQRRFHESSAHYRLFGGAAGPGKSESVLQESVRLCSETDGIHGWIFRRTYRELEESQILRLLSRIPGETFSYNQSKHLATFANGSKLWFRYCKSPQDVYSYQSAEMDFLAIDELTHFAWEEVAYLLSRVRATVEGSTPRFFAATNPGNVGHGWVKAMFVTQDADWLAERHISPSDVCFVPARITDNPVLMERDPDYIKRLRSLPEDKRRALLEGDWDVFEGQYFKAWRREHNVIAPFAIPDAWPRVIGGDYGAVNPFCALWLAADPAYPLTPTEGRVYVYREHYEAEQGIKHHVERVQYLGDGDGRPLMLLDPSAWAKTQETDRGLMSIADQIGALGLRVVQANNDRLGGWTVLSQLLETRPDGKPGLLVFENCHNLIRTLPAQVHDSRNVEDLDSSGEDHAVDAARYGVMGLLRVSRGKPKAGGPTARTLQLATRWGEAM